MGGGEHTYLRESNALDVLVEVHVLYRLAVESDRARLRSSSQNIPDAGSTVAQPRVSATFLLAINKRFAEGAVVSLHLANPD